MRLIGCDLHASQQSIAMLDRDTGAVIEKTLKHDGEAVREFYASIPPPVVCDIPPPLPLGGGVPPMSPMQAVSIRKMAARAFMRVLPLCATPSPAVWDVISGACRRWRASASGCGW